MWNQTDLDYHTNYILPRVNWADSDIREEALCFTFFAHGLRVARSQKASQMTMHGGQRSGLGTIGGSKTGSRNLASSKRRKKSIAAESQAKRVSRHSSGSNLGTPISFQHGSGAEGGSHCCVQEHTPRCKSMYTYCPNAFGRAAYRAHLARVEAQNLGVVGPYGVLNPDGKTYFMPYKIGPSYYAIEQLLVAAHKEKEKEKNIMAPLIERLAEKNTDDDNSLTLSTLGDDDGITNAFDETMEGWFEKQASGKWWYGFWALSRRFGGK